MSLDIIHKKRRAITALICSGVVILTVLANPNNYQTKVQSKNTEPAAQAKDVESGAQAKNSEAEKQSKDTGAETQTKEAGSETQISETNHNPLASEILAKLEIKGRAPKTGYKRTEFYNGWPDIDGCNLRQRILKRDFGETAVLDKKCNVVAGKFYEPYTGKVMEFHSRKEISKEVQIDHVVALSDAWQKGAQYKTSDVRYKIATDPLNLIAVQAAANQQKSDGDAATWLPRNKGFRCQYVARQISVKFKYELWVTEAERNAMAQILERCPGQRAY